MFLKELVEKPLYKILGFLEESVEVFPKELLGGYLKKFLEAFLRKKF